MTVDERVSALEAENLSLREAIRSLERGVAAHKQINFREPQHRALRAICQSVPVDVSTEPFVRPDTKHYATGREVN